MITDEQNPKKDADPFPSLEAIGGPKLSDLVAERIAQAIEEGGLEPGDRLPSELELTQRLGVGRTSVREGLQQLKVNGLVETRKRQGTFVAEAKADDAHSFRRWSARNRFAIADLLEVRLSLEATTAALAALRGSDGELSELRGRHLEHESAGKFGSLADLIRTDELFHRELSICAHNLPMRRMIEGLNSDSDEFRRRTFSRPNGPKQSASGHRKILEAVEAHEEGAARRAMISHLWRLYVQVDEAAATQRKRNARITASRRAF